jgi:two-component system chemotaxis response regulator CheY
MSKPWQGKSVVIVDDSPSVREQLRQTYEAIGMRIAGFAGNGVEALELVAKTSPELVSLDLIMPEMDGVECFRKLRRHHPEVRILVVSWLGSEQKIIENLKDVIPAHLFQAKPALPEGVRQKLERIYELPPSASSPVTAAVDSDEVSDEPSGLRGLSAKVS